MGFARSTHLRGCSIPGGGKDGRFKCNASSFLWNSWDRTCIISFWCGSPDGGIMGNSSLYPTSLTIGIIISAIALTAGSAAAARKNRGRWWRFLCFLFPPLLLVLFALPARPAAAGSELLPRIQSCPVCTKEVSTHAPTCPHCGHPIATRTLNLRSGYITGFERIAGWVVAIAMIAAIFSVAVKSHPGGLPSCDSGIAKENVRRTIANAPLGKIAGVSIIRWNSTSTVSSSSTEVRCSGNVTLNNATDRDVAYKFYIQDGRIYVHFALLKWSTL
jgi:hypothetical protein